MCQNVHNSHKKSHLQSLLNEETYSESNQVISRGSSELSTPDIKDIQFLLCDVPSTVRNKHAHPLSQREAKQNKATKLKDKVKNLENQIMVKEQQLAQLNGTVVQLKSRLTVLQNMITTSSFNIDLTLQQLLASTNSLLNGTIIRLESRLAVLQDMIITANSNIDATLRQLLASTNSL